MKRVYTLLFVAILSLTAVSCFKDKGNYDYTPENRFEVTLQPEITNDEETYWIVRPVNGPDSVVFTVSVAQTLAADSTNLEVSWFILENETEERDTAYGFRHTFHFPMGANRDYEVSLFVHDDLTGLSYQDDFSVRTRVPFQWALAVLHGEEGDRQVGFLDYPASNNFQDSATVVLDAYLNLHGERFFQNAELIAFTPGTFGDDNLLVLAPSNAWVMYPYTMNTYYANETVYWASTPVNYSFVGSCQNMNGVRMVLIAENGRFYVGDRWGYLYEVDLDPDMPSNYTATAAYAIPGAGRGVNLVWDGNHHSFYYQQPGGSDPFGYGRYDDATKAGAVLRSIDDGGSMPVSDAELADMELLWLGKGIPDLLEERGETATAIMRGSDGIHFIHFGYQNDESGSGVTSNLFVIQDEAIEPRQIGTEAEHDFTDETHFAATNAFSNYLFFTDGTDVYRLDNGPDKEIVFIASLEGLMTVDGEPVGSISKIVDMQFRVPYLERSDNFPTVPSARVLTVAYNTVEGVGGITDIYLTTGGDLDHTTSYAGFGPIVDIEYMGRTAVQGFENGVRNFID